MDRRRGWWNKVAGGIGVLLALSVWGAGPVGAGPSFDGQGRILAIDPGRGTVTIDHSGIAGLLSPTQSEFPVQNAGLIQNVQPGDRVRFTLGTADDSHGLLTVTSLTAEGTRAGWLDRVALSVVTALVLLTLAAVTTVGILLWQQLQSLRRRVVTLDHEAGMLRGLVTDTQDGVRQIAHALEESATALRVGYLQQLQRRLIATASPAATDISADKATGETVAGLIVVQRGHGELYRAVETGAAGPRVAVIWDRRRSERRRTARRPVSDERRNGERRGAPPETWTRLGFQVVPGMTELEPSRGARALRSINGERGA